MKRFVGCFVAVVVILVLATIPSLGAGGFGGSGQHGSAGHWGGANGGGHFDRDRFHGRSGFFFVGAFPFWYPYCWPPYYYDYPPPYYYYDGYNYAPRYYYDSGPQAPYYYDRDSGYLPNDTRSPLVLGHDAGKGLRNKTVMWQWFVEYLKAYIVNAPSWVRDEFQRGFAAGYGNDAESTFKKGIQQAQQPSVSSTESLDTPKPNPSSPRN
jgi:hypothetical protein